MVKMAEDRIEVTYLMGEKLDKPSIMKWKSETKKNKMAEVAALFGKKLDEEFIINEHPARYYYLYNKRRKVKVWDPKIGWTTEYESECNAPDSHQAKCKFTKNGLFTCDEWSKGWRYDECTLEDLLTGRATIVGEQKTHVKGRKKLI